MDTLYPLASCIMVTANRPQFVASSIVDFLLQDYPNKELVIIDDGISSCQPIIPLNAQIRYQYFAPIGTIGKKRNLACRIANGQFIVNWDDDDWYAPNWISRQIEQLTATGADLSGLSAVRFHCDALESSFVYESAAIDQPWICGATMAFRKSLWKKYPFANYQIGEDTDFIKNCGGEIVALNYLEGFTAKVHAQNTSIRYIAEIIPQFIEGKLVE